MIKRKLFLFLILSAVPLLTSAQTLNQYIKAAEEALKVGNYYSASRYYQIALEFDTTRSDLWYQYAYASQNLEAFNRAIRGYQQVLSSQDGNDYPLAGFYLAQSFYRTGRYREAIYEYERFLSYHPNSSPNIQMQASKGMDQSQWAMAMTEAPQDISVSNLGPGINYVYDDLAPFAAGDTLYFTRRVFLGKKARSKSDQDVPVYRIYRAIGQGVATPFEELNDQIPNAINVAHLVFNRTRTTAYFSMGPYKEAKTTSNAYGNSSMPYFSLGPLIGDTTINFNIYSMDKQENGSWSTPKPLAINMENTIAMQPNLSYDQALGKEVLYFSSDRPGGLGSMDIWHTTIEGPDALTVPVNLSAVNTAGKEESPFFYAPSQTLYFSSDGYNTFGGMDLFKTELEAGAWTRPENMGVPINSSYHDQYYYLSDNGQTYLSSTRVGAIFDDSEVPCGCFDLWSNTTFLQLELIDDLFGTPVSYVKVRLQGNNAIIEPRVYEHTGIYEFEVGRDHKYTLSIDETLGFYQEIEMEIVIENSNSIRIPLQPTADFATQPSIDLYFDHLPVRSGHKFKKTIRKIPEYGMEYEGFTQKVAQYNSAISTISSSAAERVNIQEKLSDFLENKLRSGKQSLDEFANYLLGALMSVDFNNAGDQFQVDFNVEVPPRPGTTPLARQAEAEAMFTSLMAYLRNFEGGMLAAHLDAQRLIFRLLPQNAEDDSPDLRQIPVTKDQLEYYSAEYLSGNVLRIQLR